MTQLKIEDWFIRKERLGLLGHKTEIVKETEKAYLIRFSGSIYVSHPVEKWVPKSVVIIEA